MTLNLGALSDELYEKNQEIAQVNEQLKVLDTEKRDIEQKLLGAMQEAGTDIVRGSLATVSVSETVRPQLQDFEAFSAFAIRKKALYLFEKRISSNAYKELKAELGNRPIPGITEFVQTKLNVRKV